MRKRVVMPSAYQHVTHTFGPVYDENAKILILGSMPSVKSREQQFYYGHPQNRFWKMLARLFEEVEPEGITQKRSFLLRNRIALWDVIASCDIVGSSDSSIRNVKENDMRVINAREKQNQLFRIEQYVDMALQYTRLGAETNDFVLQNISLDEAIRPSIHKYAKLFIHKQLRLTYDPQRITAVSDKKWLGFVMDQLLSNAVKYTRQGGVTIRVCRITQAQKVNLETGVEKGKRLTRSP